MKIDLRNSDLPFYSLNKSPLGSSQILSIPDHQKSKFGSSGWIFYPVVIFGILLFIFFVLGNRFLRAQIVPLVQIQPTNQFGQMVIHLDTERLLSLEPMLAQGQQASIDLDILYTRSPGLLSQERLLGSLALSFWYDPFQDVWALEAQESQGMLRSQTEEFQWFQTWPELVDQVILIPLDFSHQPNLEVDEQSAFRIRVSAELPNLNSHLWILRPFLFGQMFTQYVDVTWIPE